MSNEDENSDRLCEPQYHRGETIRKYMAARIAVISTQRTIEKLEKQLETETEERYLRETEIREWMRRDKQKQAVFPLREIIPQRTHVLFVDTEVSHAFADFKVLEVQRP